MDVSSESMLDIDKLQTRLRFDDGSSEGIRGICSASGRSADAASFGDTRHRYQGDVAARLSTKVTWTDRDVEDHVPTSGKIRI